MSFQTGTEVIRYTLKLHNQNFHIIVQFKQLSGNVPKFFEKKGIKFI